ncbi:hypothetical protein Nepgr_019001 [Nepenthes gracilis]|uniref:Nitrate regulatory gene2 protein-like n=1 Tax=Nepenthes gracilis TaxID=150966 RepID=A0AAD3XUT8_NEPGR|nr:hypothetical protein Nepgr_019001 [Nepenthes gracilis]
MGCGGSKEENLPLVSLCKERKEFIRAASNHRYALAAAHVTYFRSLKEVGDALFRFVDEELVVASSSSSSPSSVSPVLTLPSDEGKTRNRKKKSVKLRSISDKKKSPPSSLLSHSMSNENSSHNNVGVDVGEEEFDDSHLQLSSSNSEVSSGHVEIDQYKPNWENASPPMPGITYSPPVMEYINSYGDYYSQYNPYDSYNPSNSYTYYMRKSSTRIPTVIYEEPKPGPIYSYSTYQNYPSYENRGHFGFMMNSIPPDEDGSNRQQREPKPPPTPPSPKVSAWDYFNPFETLSNDIYQEYYSQTRYGDKSNASSPDSEEVREREGIPDLEEETESELIKERYVEDKKVREDVDRQYKIKKKSENKNVKFAEGKGDNFSGGTSKEVPLQHLEPGQSVEVSEEKNSNPDRDASVSNSTEEVHEKQRGVSFEVDGASFCDIGSSKFSGLSTLSAHGTRDLREVARQIKDEFDAAADYGNEVSVLLEAGKLQYRPRSTFFRALFYRFLSSDALSMSSSHPPSALSAPSSSGAAKGDTAHFGDYENGSTPCSLSSTLEKLYEWEKKLYKEVKAEERLRVIYEKKFKKLKSLEEQGAETSKIESNHNSMRKLLTKIDVSIRAVDSISSRIHKLRDEELQPQLRQLIYGLRRMWKSMLKCHQKQFQAILESKTRSLKANTGFRRDSSLCATLKLEMELLKWCRCFNEWIDKQRFYAKSINSWLFRCLLHEQEETPDGIPPFSPGRVGAPPVFVMCHDWNQSMERILESGVKTAMNNFATSLHQLWERQDEEQRQRVKAEYMLKDFEKQIQTLRMEGSRTRQRPQNEHDDALSDKDSHKMVPSENGVSRFDDLKVDLDSMRQRIREERAGHKEAVKLVHDALSRSIQAGLIPIFEALESFTSEASKAFEDVRV